jgi:hypothetical protein
MKMNQPNMSFIPKPDLIPGPHSLIIQGDENATEKTIDMLSIIK